MRKGFIKKKAAILLSLSLVAGALPAQPLLAAEQEKEEAQAVEEGEEIAYERIELSTAQDFASFSKKCYIDSWSENKYVYLKNDIDLSEVEYDTIAVFGGIFDGAGHTISGFNHTGDGYVTGLFRYISASGVVQNLTLRGAVDSENEKECIGSIGGINYGTIKGCTFQGTVSGRDTVGGIAGINESTGTVASCSVMGRITGYYSTGGIVGINHGALNYCTNRAGINDDSAWVEEDDEMGGILESLTANDDNEIYSGVDTGGIAGYSDGVISRCTNTGTVGYEHTGYNIGGIAGRQAGIVSLCTNAGTVYGRKDVGGIVGQMEPFIEIDEAESLRNAINKLHDLIDKTIDDMQAAKDVVKSDVDAMQSYADSAIDTGDVLADQLTDFVDKNIDQVNSVTQRMEHVIDMLPDVMDYISQAGNGMTRFNDVMKDLANDLDISEKLDDSAYNETDYSRLTLLSTVGGTISSDSTNPQKNDTVTITVEPDEGYELKSGSLVVQDAKKKKISVKSAGNNKYTFTMPKENVKVTAEFAYIGTFLVKSTVGGTVRTTVEDDTYTFEPKAGGGYQFKEITVDGEVKQLNEDGKLVLSKKAYIKNNKSVTVMAVFEEKGGISYQVNVESGTGGTAFAATTTAKEGDEVTLTVTASNNYEIDTIKVNGSSDGIRVGESASQRKFTMPNKDANVEVTFKYKEPQKERVYVESSVGGTVTRGANSSGVFNIIITPKNGYTIADNALTITLHPTLSGTAAGMEEQAEEEERSAGEGGSEESSSNEGGSGGTGSSSSENGSGDEQSSSSSGGSEESSSSEGGSGETQSSSSSEGSEESSSSEGGSGETQSSSSSEGSEESSSSGNGSGEVESSSSENGSGGTESSSSENGSGGTESSSSEDGNKETENSSSESGSEESSSSESSSSDAAQTDSEEKESDLQSTEQLSEATEETPNQDAVYTYGSEEGTKNISKSDLKEGDNGRYTYVFDTNVYKEGYIGVYANFVKEQSSDAEGAEYTIAAASSTGGIVAVDMSSAKAGERVYITPSAANSYVLKELKVYNTSSGNAAITTQKEDNGKRYSFEMPAGDVKITALYEPIEVVLKSNLSGNASYAGGAEGMVTLTVRPNSAYVLKNAPTVKDASGKNISVSKKQSGSYIYEFDLNKATAPCTVNITFKKQNKEQTVKTSKQEIQDLGDELSKSADNVQKSIDKIRDITTNSDGSMKSWEQLDANQQQEVISEVLNLVDYIGEMSADASVVLSNLTTIYNILEPYVEDAAKAAKNDLNKAIDEIQSVVDALKAANNSVRGIVNYMNAQPDIQFAKLGDNFDVTKENFHDQLKALSESIKRLSDNTSAHTDVINEDLRAVNDQMNVVFNLLADRIVDVESLSIEEFYEEVKDEDIDTITTGRADACKNKGVIKGDINVGGIAGSMSIDDEDPEDSAAGSVEYEIGRRFITKCLVTDSVNEGYITAKKDGAGGICGYMNHGIIIDSEGYGSVESTEGGYVGGICGESLTIIKHCYALCSVAGGKNVGGIAGYAETLTDCYAMASVEAENGRAGAIAGQIAGYEEVEAEAVEEDSKPKVEGNYFVEDVNTENGMNGIDNISYIGVAEPISYRDLLTVEQLPTQFRHLKVIYRIEDTYLGSEEIEYGKQLDSLTFPQIPEKEGFYGVWPDVSERKMGGTFVVEAEYKENVTVVQSSSGVGADTVDAAMQKPYALVEDIFTEDTILHAAISDMAPPEEAAHKEHVVYEVSIQNGGIKESESFALRLLNPYKESTVYGYRDGSWAALESKVRGQYLQVPMTGTHEYFCIADKQSNRIVIICIAAAAAVALILLVVIIKKARARRKKKKTPRLK